MSSEVRRNVALVRRNEHESRTSAVAKWASELPTFQLFPAAAEALRRFGGLTIADRGPGEQQARVSFSIDPTLCIDEEVRFEAFARYIGSRLYPLGEVANGDGFMAIAEDGRVFALSMEMWLIGDSMEEALEHLVRGLKWTATPYVLDDDFRMGW